MKTKIRVLFLQTGMNPWSFASVHSLLMRYFNRERVEVHVACITTSKGEKNLSYRMLETIPDLHIRPTNFGPVIFQGSKIDIVRNILSAGPAVTVSVTGLINYIKQHHIDIVHVAEKPRDAFCGTLLAKLTGTKSIFHLHAKCGSWMTAPVRWAMKHANGIICVSHYGAQCALDEGYPVDKIYFAHNSVDAGRWNYDTDGSKVRSEFGMAPYMPLFSIIAALAPWKGHELLFNALSQIKSEIPDFKLLIVGDDNQQGSINYVKYLKEIIRELDLSKHVVFTGFRSDIQQILAASDIFTMPAIDEPFGLVFAEAMAMKKAIIALDQGGTPEVVEQSKSGLLSPPGDVERLAENILTLVNSPSLRKQMGEYGRKRVEKLFNPQRMANEVERIYRLVLGDSVEEQDQLIPALETLHQK